MLQRCFVKSYLTVQPCNVKMTEDGPRVAALSGVPEKENAALQKQQTGTGWRATVGEWAAQDLQHLLDAEDDATFRSTRAD